MLKNAIIFSLSANEELATKISDKLGIALSPRSIRTFPSGETICEPVDSVRGKTCFIIQSTCPPVNQNLMEVLIFADALKRSSAKEINLVVPYFGYARQDRKTKPRQPITSALVAHLLTTAGVSRVITVNLHATQIQGFFGCLADDLTAIPLLAKNVMNERNDFSDCVVVSPDHGGVNRARELADSFNTPIAIMDKRRKSDLEPEVMNIIGDVSNKDCYIVDDMIDTGKSAVSAAVALKQAGAKDVYMLAVHGVFSDPCYDLVKDGIFKEMIVTDSIPLSERLKKLPFIKVVSLTDMLAECIKRIVLNEPLSAIFETYALPINNKE